MIRFLIELVMFGCTIFTIVHIIKKFKAKKLKKQTRYEKTPKLSDLHGKKFSDYIDYLKNGLK